VAAANVKQHERRTKHNNNNKKLVRPNNCYNFLRDLNPQKIEQLRVLFSSSASSFSFSKCAQLDVSKTTSTSPTHVILRS